MAHLVGLLLVTRIDGSEVGRNCMTMIFSLIDQKRAIPLVWTELNRPQGHLTAQEHSARLERF